MKYPPLVSSEIKHERRTVFCRLCKIPRVTEVHQKAIFSAVIFVIIIEKAFILITRESLANSPFSDLTGAERGNYEFVKKFAKPISLIAGISLGKIEASAQ